jgi:hypothetical protein
LGKTNEILSTDEITEPKYSHFLCFTVSVKTNKFVYFPLEKYTPQQKEIYELIKSLHDNGMGYRRISYHLNDKGIKTTRGNEWKSNNVFSVLKRHKEREERLEYINREYEPEWGKMREEWTKN